MTKEKIHTLREGLKTTIEEVQAIVKEGLPMVEAIRDGKATPDMLLRLQSLTVRLRELKAKGDIQADALDLMYATLN